MFSRNKYFPILISCLFILFPQPLMADEMDIFGGAVKPDVLFILDMSSSMTDDVAGRNCNDPGTPQPCIRRIDIAKAAVKAILDNNNDGVIGPADEASLGVNFGYMVFNGFDNAGDPFSGSVILKKPIGTPYATLWSEIDRERTGSGTPLVNALTEAKTYLDIHRAGDPEKDCRQKYAVLLSDGFDTSFQCEGQLASSHIRRKALVTYAKALADAGYKLFVIGFGGDFSLDLKYILNWAAYYGGTDNPLAENSGNISVITPIPAGQLCSSSSGINDPGSAPLLGYAYLTEDADSLRAAFQKTIDIIKAARLSFTTPSVASTRVQDQNYLYEASFSGVLNDPFWMGRLRKYAINPDGSVDPTPLWDAGDRLQARSPSARNMFTYLNGSMVVFDRPAMNDKKLFDVATGDDVNNIIGYVRGEPAYNPENWKLGDIFHSNPVTIGSPSLYFNDPLSPQAFIDFRTNMQSRTRVIVAGSNDGQFRAFNTENGEEVWSFVPPNLLPKLKYLVHLKHPVKGGDLASYGHQYFVDGPVTAADVWLGTGNGTNKSRTEWETLVIFGEGRGVRNPQGDPAYLWSGSSSCNYPYNSTYTNAYRYYCGYYAFGFTDTTSPAYKWRVNPNSSQGPYLGEPWSKFAIGKVKIGGGEKWVGFIGGGFNTSVCGATCDDPRGKGFFVVDLSNGNILWSYTRADHPEMNYSFPGSPAAADTDNDGFVDTAYIGDLGGNVWRFKFCPQGEGPGCNTGNWSGGLFFRSSGGKIFTTPTVAKASGSVWVFWGTGDRVNPNAAPTQDKFFALKDDWTSTYTIANLQNITAGVYGGLSPGWYIDLTGDGEKLISNPTVYSGVVSFITYTPTSEVCAKIGISRLYAMAMTSLTIDRILYDPGAGLLSEPSNPSSREGGARSVVLGEGISSGPIISQNPQGGANIYVSLSGGSTTQRDTKVISNQSFEGTPLAKLLSGRSPRTQMIHWRDRRIR